MKIIYIYLLLFFSFYSCSTIPKQGAGNARFAGRYAAQLDPGEEEIWGSYQEVATRRANGTYARRMFFPETYKLTSFQTFTDPALRNAEGPYRFYSDMGELRVEGQYTADERTGTWLSYQPETGQLLERGDYVAGKKEGEWTSFDKAARKSEAATYSAGDLVREITYDSTGVVKNDIRYVEGEVVEVLAGEKPALSRLVERMPLFAGCGDYTEATYEEVKRCADRSMLEFIYGSIRYPARARNNEVEGMGIISFVVEKDGSVGELKVVRGLNVDISQEMIRVASMMPDWIPGRVDGKNVRVQFNLPVKFKLE
jgi:TonB family protein